MLLLRIACALYGVFGFMVSIGGIAQMLFENEVYGGLLFCGGGSLFCLATIVEMIMLRLPLK